MPLTEHRDKMSFEEISSEQVSSKTTPHVDVTNFGAKENLSKDNTQAFQDAIDYLHNQLGGGTLFVPNEENSGFLIKDSLTWYEKITLKGVKASRGTGSPEDGSYIKYEGTTPFFGGTLYSVGVEDIRINATQDVSILGNHNPWDSSFIRDVVLSPASGGKGVDLYGLSGNQTILENVTVWGGDPSFDLQMDHITAWGCASLKATTGWKLGGQRTGLFMKCRALDATTGFDIVDGRHLTFVKCRTEGCDTAWNNQSTWSPLLIDINNFSVGTTEYDGEFSARVIRGQDRLKTANRLEVGGQVYVDGSVRYPGSPPHDLYMENSAGSNVGIICLDAADHVHLRGNDGQHITLSNTGYNKLWDKYDNVLIECRRAGDPFTFNSNLGSVQLDGNPLQGGTAAGTRVNIDDFLNLPPRASAPSSPSNGDVAVQDGVNWDPAGTGAQEVVAYLDGAWVALS